MAPHKEAPLKKFLLIALLLLLFSKLSVAAWGWPQPSRWDLRTGYGYQYTNRSRPTNFQVISVMPSAVFHLTDAVGPGWFRGRFNWNPELHLGLFIHPYDRPIFGINPIQFQWEWETHSRWKPYLVGGTGVAFANVNRRETRSHSNFSLHGGVGTYLDLNERLSLIAEYRHTHISNAGLDEDNSGIDTHTFLIGASSRR